MSRRAASALALLLSQLLLPQSASAADIVGSAIPTSGDDILVAGVSIRLCGIDAVERGEPGHDAAVQFLRSLTVYETVRCVPVGEGTICDALSKPTSYHRVIAQCFIDDMDMGGDVDLAGEMVRAGYACAWPKFSGDHYISPGACVSQRP